MDVPRCKAIVLLGAPGAGKGTQGKVLGQVPGFVHFSTGDMFRALDPASPLGREVSRYSSRGALVPDELTVRLFFDALDRLIAQSRFDPARQLLVLDGIPRNPAQLTMLADRIEPVAVVHLVARDREEMVRRLTSRARQEGRVDDADPAVIRHRLDVYDQATRPLLDLFPPDRVHEVDAIGPPARVLRDVLTIVAPIQERETGNPLG